MSWNIARRESEVEERESERSDKIEEMCVVERSVRDK